MRCVNPITHNQITAIIRSNPSDYPVYVVAGIIGLLHKRDNDRSNRCEWKRARSSETPSTNKHQQEVRKEAAPRDM